MSSPFKHREQINKNVVTACFSSSVSVTRADNTCAWSAQGWTKHQPTHLLCMAVSVYDMHGRERAGRSPVAVQAEVLPAKVSHALSSMREGCPSLLIGWPKPWPLKEVHCLLRSCCHGSPPTHLRLDLLPVPHFNDHGDPLVSQRAAPGFGGEHQPRSTNSPGEQLPAAELHLLAIPGGQTAGHWKCERRVPKAGELQAQEANQQLHNRRAAAAQSVSVKGCKAGCLRRCCLPLPLHFIPAHRVAKSRTLPASTASPSLATRGLWQSTCRDATNIHAHPPTCSF